MKKLAILGSTGSIGVNTLDIVGKYHDRYEVIAMSAGTNIEMFKKQILRFKPRIISVLNRDLASRLKEKLGKSDTEIFYGVEGVKRVATASEVDMVVSAIVGAAGLIPTISAIRAGKNIALANKETLVMAGKVVMKEAKENGIMILPVDSEHSAIFQSLLGHRKKDIKRIILTASGGPFLNVSQEELKSVTIEEALAHPKWDMGRKITIDSASLMNKGLEVIEARWLFDIPHEKIDVCIHPQSIVHSMVEYIDNSIVAQMGLPDMRCPISYALSYPERLQTELPSVNFLEISGLTFQLPDEKRFPALKLAYRAIEEGGTMPAVLNAANEIAVDAFLQKKVGFTGIPSIIEQTMDFHKAKEIHTIQDATEADQWARVQANKLV
ncbi:MAG: 1-deoxy-D-xylulose-5-phosphate reductoisomerase [Thermodesulfobacteriota bacterium]|nr:1-deoxy-D-xylulose-5-phosphate reductoisomerase [Thermodesulfobacteriota bacterium]